MNDEKDKQRRISAAARSQRERYKLEKRIDEITGRLRMTAHPLERLDREEELLREWCHDLFSDRTSMGIFRSVRARHEPEIVQWAKAFLSWHPVAEQRTPQAIKAWADDIPWPDEYRREFAALAVRLFITLQIEEEASEERVRRADMMQAAHQRITAARRRAAVFDGDLDRARPGYHVGPGWHSILDDLVKDFAEINDLGFLSAHEKWGGLRIVYLYTGDRQADVDAIVKRAAERAIETCWYCGRPGTLRKERWWRVRCEEHWSAE